MKAHATLYFLLSKMSSIDQQFYSNVFNFIKKSINYIIIFEIIMNLLLIVVAYLAKDYLIYYLPFYVLFNLFKLTLLHHIKIISKYYEYALKGDDLYLD